MSEAVWLSNQTVAYVNGTALWHFGLGETDSGKQLKMFDFPEGSEPSSLKYEPTTQTLAFCAAVWQDGDIENTGKHDAAWADRGYSGIVFDDLFVRHWDTWRTPGRVYTVASTLLNRRRSVDGRSEEFTASREYTNLLNGTGIYSQMDPIGSDLFSISETKLAIALKPTHLNTAIHTRMDVYLLPLAGPRSNVLTLTQAAHGAISALSFSPDGKKLVWLEMAKDGYESDKRVVTVHTLNADKIGSSERWTAEWDRSPSDVVWDLRSQGLYLIAEYNGKVLPYHLETPGRLPTPLLFKGSTSSITQLSSHDHFLLSVSTLTSPTEIFFLDLEDGPSDPDKMPHEELRQITHYAESHIGGRLDDMAGEELWFKGVDGRRVMAWVLKPRGWSKDDAPASYPLAFFIHGGPQGAWEDSWSTRWNTALFASMGYFVVAVNPTGSTGYGQDFTDRIQSHWGDRPFQDLVAGYHAALDKYPEIDPERTAGLGASYGGYMVNWINGHNIFGFKALVYHDGIFSTLDTFYSTEEVWFPTQDFGGTLLSNREVYERWNPMNHVSEWATPQLVIQGGKDFRLAESQAISTFTALQLQGVPSRFLYFPDENHWVLKAHNSVKWHTEVLRWLDEWVGHGKDVAPSRKVETKSKEVVEDVMEDVADLVAEAAAWAIVAEEAVELLF